jgi:hypothetical protein
MSPETKEAFSQYAGMYKDMRGDNKKAREEAKYMALMQAGFGIAGGTSPNAFANINQGVQPAMAQYQSALKDIRKDDREALKGLVDLGLSKEQFLQKAQQMGIDVYKADKVFEAHKYSADASIRAAGIRAAGEKQPRAPNATDIANAYIEGKAKQYVAQGMPLDKATVKAQEDYYAQNRPMQPTAGIAPSVTARIKEDSILEQLNMDRFRARNNPARLKEIDQDIKDRTAEIAREVAGQSTPGRGTGGTGGNTNDPFGLFTN